MTRATGREACGATFIGASKRMSPVRLVILRPPDKWDETRRVCAERGVEPVLVPLLHLREGRSTDLEAFSEALREDRAGWVVFTGASGVQAVLDHAAERGLDRSLVTALNRTRVAAIGPRTERALANAGVGVALVPDRTDSQGLVDALVEAGVDGVHVELPRSDRGSDVLREGLQEAGATVHEFAAYTLTVAEDESVLADAVRQLREGEAAAIAFTSALTAATFFDLAHRLDFGPEDLKEVVVAAMGEPTAKALRAQGIDPDVVPDRADLGLLVEGVQEKVGGGA